jgi:hypothetical protein
MATHKVRITQVSRVERSIVVDVEADSIEEAIEMQQESDAPPLDDPRWTIDSSDLKNEEVEAA